MRIELSENIKNKILKIFTQCAEKKTIRVIVLNYQNDANALDLTIYRSCKDYVDPISVTAYFDYKNVEIQLDRMLRVLSEIGC